ncbi:sensor histidine kinase [Prauserella muralis]|uniref:sensor histidine kinase n=1 Tax=Prauserella muralis TaxID=588067 RepID=UPI000DD4763F|nr:nitrate- and nitrite sensing domain-containing protein [Prauserella muralis]TWE22130.1 signal transduction histidine kinase [Prauserella muralis]
MPVGKLLGRQSPKPPRWRALTRWRDWSLPVKLGAVTLIPIVIALVLGGLTFSNQLERSDRYDRVDQLARLGAATGTLLDGLQRERTRTAEALTAGSGANSPELRQVRGEVDRAIAPTRSALDAAAEADGGLAAPRAAVTEQLGKLTDLRQRIQAGQVGTVDALNEYSAITSALLDLDTALVAGIGDDAIGGTPNALHNLLVAKDEVSVQQALIDYGIARGGLAPSEFNQLRTSEVRFTDRIADFRTAATAAQRQDFDAAVRGEAFDERDRVVERVLAGQDSGNSDAFSSAGAAQWRDASGTVFNGLGQVSGRLATQLTSTATDLAGGASANLGVLAVVLVLALALAVLVVFLITRQLLRSLRQLRSSALDVAHRELPEAVRTIQEGRSQSTEITPVPVRTDDEIGEVARAFDAVHSEALRLAAEQAGMRTGYASVFVNLSRRSQSLVQRQLQLIERLERDEEDADQLAILFQLDHLATRMRRNNENLMVLSGAEPGRRSGQPVTVTDVLRAAVSEIEQYQRVVVRTPPPARVVGYAAGDLVRLVAELLDNATAFSAPETQVTVATRRMDDGSLSIDILDKGIGMNEAEVAEANTRLTEAGSVDLATSRRMGLFVVGRLAGRHGFGVALHGGKDIVGVRATVSVPAELVMGQEQGAQPPGATTMTQPPALPQHPEPQSAAPARQAPAQGPGALPRRKPNGASRSGVLPGAAASGQQPPPPPTDNEVSGTALFTPIGREKQDQQRTPPPVVQPPARPAEQSPAAPEESRRNGAVVPAAGTAGQQDPPAADESEATESMASPPAPRRGQPEAGSTTQPESKPETQAGARSEPGTEEGLSGRDLFEAQSTTVSDWWSAATTESDAQRRAQRIAESTTETTPIFDEMLSAWFRSVTESANEKSADKSDWDFAADERWRTVQAVSQRQAPSDYTQAGLPRRRRGEQLLPGSAVPTTPPAPEQAAAPARKEIPPRDPADVRGRLSSFQQGVNRGRRHRKPEPDAAGGAGQASAPAESAQGARSNQASGLPQRQPKKQAQTGESREGAPADAGTSAGAGGSGGAPASGWAFSSDERWRTVQAVSEATPSSYTAAGLPRRRRGEQLLPGSVSAQGSPESPPRRERDPADVRGRLSSFQQGIRRGRHRTAQATESSDEKVEGE